MGVFPRWAGVLGLGATPLEGRDLPLGDPPEHYRRGSGQVPLLSGANA